MDTILTNAPLVELVAELTWDPDSGSVPDAIGPGVNPQIPSLFFSSPLNEDFFLRFGAAVYQLGFEKMERLVPPGIPLPNNVVVCRYRHKDESTPVLVQVGPNIFSINALPPYKSWKDFRPWIQKAIDALIKARNSSTPLSVSVRYIDAFDSAAMNSRTPSDFFHDDLGIYLNLPRAIEGRRIASEPVKIQAHVEIPLDGKKMTIRIGEGPIRGSISAILDTHVAVVEPVASDQNKLLESMDECRKVIHESFMQLIEPVKERFGPSKV